MGAKRPATGIIVSTLTFVGALGTAHALKDYPGCGPVVDTEFKVVTLASRTNALMDEPLKMAFDMDAQGRVDVYMVERKGKVRKYNAAGNNVTEVGKVDASVEFEEGLSGIALDPAFKTNKWMYLFYAKGAGADFRFRVSRFTLNGAGQLDMASEKVIMAIPAVGARLHTGGAMTFDPHGNLWITVGDNAAGEEGPGNTNDWRGKILRIKPKPLADGAAAPAPGVGTTYDIPAGNLFPPGTDKTKPEIYIMGTRNAYSIALDPSRNLVAWGDVGPDGKGAAEEHNTAPAPGNYGYPYFAGNQISITAGGTPQNPVNNNPKNTGLKELPPAITATHAYAQACAITGPIYRYDPKSTSTVKFPPHFDGMWFISDCSRNVIDTVLLNPAGTTKLGFGQSFKNIRLDRPLDFQQGPDGALYVLNYAGWFGPAATTALLRIEYTGACRPTSVGVGRDLAPDRAALRAQGMRLQVSDLGSHTLRLADLSGRELAAFEGRGAKAYDLASALGRRPGLYVARLTTAAGSVSRTVYLAP